MYAIIISTHAPLAGSDIHRVLLALPEVNFNPRSPRGERPWPLCGSQHGQISTHAPLAGSDRHDHHQDKPRAISTHAPLAGSDCNNVVISVIDLSHFNPRSPRGERQFRVVHRNGPVEFQPTLPSRGATQNDTNSNT